MRKGYQLSLGKITPTDELRSPIEFFINPDADERRYLIDELKIDEHTLASSLDPDEISRLEFEPKHVALIFKLPKSYSGNESLTFRVASAGAFLFADRLVVVATEDIQLFNGKPLARVTSFPGLFLKLISRSTFHFLDHLKIINTLTDELEAKINLSMENRYLINLFGLEKSLVYYLNAINSNGAVIEKLRNYTVKIGFTVEEAELLDDILVENSQCYKQAEIYSNILASLMDARVSIVSNNLNILMKTLNIITIGIMVPTLVVSAFSMNVDLPFALKHNNFAFWIIMGLALCSTVLVTIIWRSQALMNKMGAIARQAARFPRLTMKRGMKLIRPRPKACEDQDQTQVGAGQVHDAKT